MFDQMSPLDAAFLDAEDEDRHVSMAISSVAVLEGPPPSHEEFVNGMRARLPLVPRYRQKSRQLPFDIGRPVWVDDPHFDITHHIRRTALPAPGDDAALCRLIARVMSQRLDRERPLWEYWVVEGLAGGRWAVISKVHHCMVDGVSGTHLYYVLFDEGPQRAPDPDDDGWTPAQEPSTLRLTANALRDLALSPVEQVRLIRQALRDPRDSARRVADTLRGLSKLGGALIPASPSSLIGPIGAQRRYAVTRASLADIMAAAKRAGASHNDVVLSAISGGFRTLLQQRGEEPVAHVIRSLVPVNVRAKGEEGIYENRVSLMLAFLPVHLADPVERMAAVHAHLAELKASKEAQAGEAMTTLARHEPFPPISWGIRLVSRLPQRNIITVTTNVPGPSRPLYLLGRRLVEILPYVPIASRLRIGVSIFTYCDQVVFGITGDFDNAPEVDLLARAIGDSLRELVTAVGVPAGRTGVPAAAAQPCPATPAAQPRSAAPAAQPPAAAPPEAAPVAAATAPRKAARVAAAPRKAARVAAAPPKAATVAAAPPKAATVAAAPPKAATVAAAAPPRKATARTKVASPTTANPKTANPTTVSPTTVSPTTAGRRRPAAP